MLGEIAGFEFPGAAHPAVQAIEPSRQQLDQGRFAVAVGAEERDPVLHVDTEIEVPQHGFPAVADGNPVHGDQRRRRGIRIGKFERGGALLHDRGDGFHPRQHFEAALGLTGLGGLGPEPVDEGLDAALFRQLPGAKAGFPGQPFPAGFLERVIAAAVSGELPAVQMNDPVGDLVQEGSLVADHHQGARPRGEITLEPHRRLEIQVIGGLVEEQQIGPGEQRAGKRHPHPPAARIFRARAPLGRLVEAETGEDRRRPGRGGMGLDVGKPGMDLGDTIRIGRGPGFGGQRGQLGIRSQHGVEQALGPAGRLLRDGSDAGPAEHRHLAVIRGNLSGDQAEQRGLAGPVAPDQADLPSLGHRDRGVIEKRPSADPVGKAVDLEHGAAARPRTVGSRRERTPAVRRIRRGPEIGETPG